MADRNLRGVRTRVFPQGHPVFEVRCRGDGSRFYPRLSRETYSREKQGLHMNAVRERLIQAAGSELQYEIAMRLASGESTEAIGRDLGISRWTVARQARQTMARLESFGLHWFLTGDSDQPDGDSFVMAV